MNESPNTLQIIALACFVLAILHTFMVNFFQRIAGQFPEGSVGENFFHLLGEVEIVFGLWAGIFFLTFTALNSFPEANAYIESQSYTEPLFVFVIMVTAATRPLIKYSEKLLSLLSRCLPGINPQLSFYFVALAIGPLLGSFITEPAAMTLLALILRERFLKQSNLSPRFVYFTIGTLFVNVSVGGVLTHFAAPPVVVVASVWNWDLPFMFNHFGWKAILICFFNSILATMVLRRELIKQQPPENSDHAAIPIWVLGIHVLFLALIVFTAHHPTAFLGFFLFFIGITEITREYQQPLKLRESLLVGFFLAGLVTLGGMQGWWLAPILQSLDEFSLFVGATVLTSFTDNAALTYLGTQVPNLADSMKYALVAGAVTGGGMTIIANAPNPAGYSILKDCFGSEGINPLRLAAGAIAPTVVAFFCFYFL